MKHYPEELKLILIQKFLSQPNRSIRSIAKEAARLLGVCDRTFRRYLLKYEEEGMEGLTDKRLTQISHRRAPIFDTEFNIKDVN